MLIAAAVSTSAVTPVAARSTFSVDYIVTIAAANPNIAQVRWEFAGIEEIDELRLHFRGKQFKKIQASGKLESTKNGARWLPGGPYGHFSYSTTIKNTRGPKGRYDSYAASNWIVTRARQLFPKISLSFTPRSNGTTKSRARLIFRLPPGWRSAAAYPNIGTDSFDLHDDQAVLDRPRGWFALGDIEQAHEEIADIMVRVAASPGDHLAAAQIFEFLNPTLPLLKKVLQAPSRTVLIANAGEPMWHGGISGENSFFMFSKRPLRTPDKTSPYLHELFHVLQPFAAGADADWIVEGLAEYYSIELQRRAGLLDATEFARALGYFERFGLWNVDLTQQHDNAATNNSAPLVMYALDQRIQHATSGRMKLDQVVQHLAKEGGVVDTARFRLAVSDVSGKKLAKFFQHHVFNGSPPKLNEAP